MALLASPKLALKRGALLTAANWQVVVLQWVADSVFTALLAVPVVGGAALVVLTSGLAPQDLFDQGLSRAVPAVAAALLAHPIALAAFLAAMFVVLLGGSLFMVERKYTFAQAVTYGFGSGMGWALAIVSMATIRWRMRTAHIPAPLKGLGITFITTGLVAMAFMTFSGI